jgi:hypothetical protein
MTAIVAGGLDLFKIPRRAGAPLKQLARGKTPGELPSEMGVATSGPRRTAR